MALRVNRTGRTSGLTGHEYLITFPDGTTDTVWSPDTHDMMPAEEDRKAAEVAKELWDMKRSEKDMPDSLIPASTIYELRNSDLTEEELSIIFAEDDELDDAINDSFGMDI